MADNERPEGIETKDTRGTLLGYIPSVVPHISRSGSELTEDEARLADGRLRNNDMTGVPEGDHKAAQFSGIITESGGTQSAPATGSTENASTVTPPKRKS